MNNRNNNRSFTSYQESLFNKYEVDESYLQNRKQRRACLELLEKIDSDRAFNEKKVIKKVVSAFKGTDLHKKIATCMTIASLIMNLQASPVMAAVKSDYNGSRQAIRVEQGTEAGTGAIIDEDSFLNEESMMEDQAENTSIRLLVKKDINSSNYENSAFIDEDSDIGYPHGTRILTVIDTSIEGWEMITLGIEEGEMLLLEDGDDPLDEIIAKLEEMNEVDELNIISHGSSGKLHFKDKTISSENLEKYRNRWEVLGSYLSKDGDVQLFGCNVAKDESGRAFIEKLADLTGADVAASINPTGNDEAGGDWVLESVVGHIEENDSLKFNSLAKFKGLLDCDTCGSPSHYTWEHDMFGGGGYGGGGYGGGGGGGDTTSPWVNSISAIGSPAGNASSVEFNVSFSENVRNVDINDFVLTKTGTATGTIASLSSSSGTTMNVTINGISGEGTLRLDLKNSGTGICDDSSNAISGGFVNGHVHTVSQMDKDATITSGDIIDESQFIDIPTTADSAEKAVGIFDFKISDGGTSDGENLVATALDINISGSDAGKLTYILSNPIDGGDLPAEGVAGSYNSGKVSFDLSGNNIVINDGGNEIYVVKAYFNDNSGLADNTKITISIDADTDITLDANGTKMKENQESVTNNAKSNVSVVATALKFNQQPGSTEKSTSGTKFDLQPEVKAVDAFGNVDVDFSETVTLTENTSGSLGGDVDVKAVDGIASFTDVVYNASVDGENFKITANDEDGVASNLETVDSDSRVSDVVATKLVFSTEPSPRAIITGRVHDFVTDPVVKAVDSNNVVDEDFVEVLTISENGAGNAMFANNSVAAVDGVATFTGLTINHDKAEAFQLQANDQDSVGSDLTMATSGDITASENKAPVLGGTFTTDGTIDDNETIKPFENVNVSDEDGDVASVKITYVAGNGALSGTGLAGSAGDYVLTAADNNQLQTRLRSLVFKPTPNQVEVGDTVQTVFTMTPNDGISDGNSDNTTKITVTSINDSPKITPWNPRLEEVLRYETDNEGQLVSRIVWDSISDQDINQEKGIAITATEDGNGKWQYSLDSGVSWLDIENIGLENALLLSLEDRVRFVPKNAPESTVASMEYKAWDKTFGNKGEKADTSASDAASSFSSQIDTARLYVEEIPDPYMDISFSESIYGDKDGKTAIGTEDFEIVFNKNSGNAKNVEIIAIKKADGTSIENASDLTGGEKKIRVFLKITGRPYGSETIEIKPVENSIFDHIGNAMQPSQTTGEKKLTGRRSIS